MQQKLDVTSDEVPGTGLVIVVGDGVRVACDQGYYLSGLEEVTCRRDVDLNLMLPTCVLSNPAARLGSLLLSVNATRPRNALRKCVCFKSMLQSMRQCIACSKLLV